MLGDKQSKQYQSQFKELKRKLKKTTFFWSKKLWYLGISGPCCFSIHLTIFIPPCLEKILAGDKVYESRFSITRQMLCKRIVSKDIILLKKTGGPIEGVCQAKKI